MSALASAYGRYCGGVAEAVALARRLRRDAPELRAVLGQPHAQPLSLHAFLHHPLEVS